MKKALIISLLGLTIVTGCGQKEQKVAEKIKVKAIL